MQNTDQLLELLHPYDYNKDADNILYMAQMCKYINRQDLKDIPIQYLEIILPIIMNQSYYYGYELIITLLEEHKHKLDLNTIFTDYLEIFENTPIAHKENKYQLMFMCNYIYNNKIDINLCTDKILMCMIKCKQCGLEEIKGIYLNIEQQAFYNKYVSPKPYTNEYLSIYCGTHCDTYVKYYALTNYKHIEGYNVDDNMIEAYTNDDIVYIRTHEHVPDFYCLLSAFSLYNVYKNSDIQILVKYDILELPISDKKYEMNDIIHLNKHFIYLGCLKSTYTFEEFCNTCYKNLIGNTTYKIDIKALLKYQYILNTNIVSKYICNYKNVFINFGNLVYYILDNYL